MADLILYRSDDATGKCQLAAAVAKKKFPNAEMTDLAGDNEAAVTAVIAALDDDNYENICVCVEIVDSHADGKMTGTQAITLIPKLLTANQGDEVAGTAAANAEVTNIKLAAGDTGEDNEYNMCLIATAGDVDVDRVIWDYVASTKVATVNTTTSAVDGSETYIIYVTDYLHLLATDNVADSTKGFYYAFSKLYPNAVQTPLLLQLVNDGTIYEKNTKTATAIAAGTLTDTGEFTAAKYDDGNYWVAIKSATTGAGQKRRIASNTANVLTLESNWDYTPTGTIVYQIADEDHMTLWSLYLPYALATYLNDIAMPNTASILEQILDKNRDLDAGQVYPSIQDIDLLAEYAEKGKAIFDALAWGVVS